MLEQLSYYEVVGYVMAPLLFILWNVWNLTRHTKRIVNAWKKKEAHLLKEWSKTAIKQAEDEIFRQSRHYMQNGFIFYLVVLITFPLLPVIATYAQIGLYPFIGWVWLVLWTHVRLEVKAKSLSKEGLPFQQVVTHERIKSQLRMSNDYKDGIMLPFLFVKSYQRSLSIHDEFSEAVRKTKSADEGKMLVSLLSKEDEGLVKDMNNAVMGRVHKYQKDGGFSEALATMYLHAWDSKLSTLVRYRALLVAERLEKAGHFPEKGFRATYDPLQDIANVENYLTL